MQLHFWEVKYFLSLIVILIGFYFAGVFHSLLKLWCERELERKSQFQVDISEISLSNFDSIVLHKMVMKGPISSTFATTPILSIESMTISGNFLWYWAVAPQVMRLKRFEVKGVELLIEKEGEEITMSYFNPKEERENEYEDSEDEEEYEMVEVDKEELEASSRRREEGSWSGYFRFLITNKEEERKEESPPHLSSQKQVIMKKKKKRKGSISDIVKGVQEVGIKSYLSNQIDSFSTSRLEELHSLLKGGGGGDNSQKESSDNSKISKKGRKAPKRRMSEEERQQALIPHETLVQIDYFSFQDMVIHVNGFLPQKWRAIEERPITLKKMEIFDIGKPFSPSSSSTSQTTKSSSTEEEEEEDRGEEVEVDEDGFQKIPPEREEEESEKEQEEEEEEIIIPFHHQVHPLSHEGVTLGEFQWIVEREMVKNLIFHNIDELVSEGIDKVEKLAQNINSKIKSWL